MRSSVLILSFLALVCVDAAVPQAATAGCTSPGELADLAASLRDNVRCVRTRLDRGQGVVCDTRMPPACAGPAVEQLVSLLSGTGAPASRVAPELRPQLGCQRAIIASTKRYLVRRVRELIAGSRRTRVAGVFAKVRHSCEVPVAAIPGTSLPTLGAPCDAVLVAPGSTLDGTTVARCTRASLERLTAEMTVGVLRPNVVLVMTDDQNVPSAEIMQRVSELRRRAVDFTGASVTTPLCGPSRASLLSALYAHHHGIISNFGAAPNFDSSSTLATWLRDAGYTTGIIGKYLNYTLALESVPPGWDDFQALISEESGGDGYNDYRINENGLVVQHGGTLKEYSTDLLGTRSVTFLQDNASAPFFLLLTPFAPHLPGIPAQRHAGSLAGIERWRPPNWHEPDVSLKPRWVQFMKAIAKPETTMEDDQFRIQQLETLLAADEMFGKVEDTLERLGLTDNTVLIFTSDHGYHWGEHWWSSKFSEYEESLRVPLVVSYPVLAPNPAVREQLVSNIDLAPTIAELAHASVPSNLDGVSFVPLLSGSVATRQDLLLQHWATIIVPSWEGVRDGRFKYVRTEATSPVTEELYDIATDPYELANLAFLPEYASKVDALRARLDELLAQ